MAQNTKHRRNKRNKSVKKQKKRGGTKTRAQQAEAAKQEAAKQEAAKQEAKVISYGKKSNYKGNRASVSVMDSDSSDDDK